MSESDTTTLRCASPFHPNYYVHYYDSIGRALFHHFPILFLDFLSRRKSSKLVSTTACTAIQHGSKALSYHFQWVLQLLVWDCAAFSLSIYLSTVHLLYVDCFLIHLHHISIYVYPAVDGFTCNASNNKLRRHILLFFKSFSCIHCLVCCDSSFNLSLLLLLSFPQSINVIIIIIIVLPLPTTTTEWLYCT